MYYYMSIVLEISTTLLLPKNFLDAWFIFRNTVYDKIRDGGGMGDANVSIFYVIPESKARRNQNEPYMAELLEIHEVRLNRRRGGS